jgi:putative PIN family toxin of toxin-antitoxin system
VRVFTDTNVVVSAFTANGLSSRLFDVLNVKHSILVSPQVLSEFRRVTIEKFKADPREVQDFLAEVIKNSEVILPPYMVTFPVRDPDDIGILAAAVKGNSDVLVTGDKDLLDIIDPPIPILTPRALYDLLITSE